MKPVNHLNPNIPPIETIAATFQASRLQQARQLALLTKQDLGEAVGVSAAAIGQFEIGSNKPKPETIAKLATALDVPPAFFASGRPYLPLETGNLFFRSLRATTAKQRNKAVSYAQQIGELTYALERHVRFPAVDLPGFFNEDKELIAATNDPVAAAQELRSAWGLGTHPVPQLVKFMESKGIVVVLVPMVESEVARIDAFSTTAFTRPVIILSPDRADDVYRHRFSAAHELGHIVLHGGCISGSPEIEREADRFAAEFLTPAASMELELPNRLDLREMIKHSQAWGVEPKMIIRRSHEIGKISEPTARRGYIRLNQLSIPTEPIAKFPGEQPSLLTKALEITEETGCSLTQIANDLRWKPSHLRKLLGLGDERPTLYLVD